MNTNAIAKKLNVSPKTVRRWVQFFDNHFTKNNHGHYVFTEQDLTFFNNIKESIHKGETIKEIKQNFEYRNEERHSKVKKDKKEEFEEKFQKIDQQLKMLESKINNKADEVVSYQILQHRKEIEEMHSKILCLEQKINQLEMLETNINEDKDNQTNNKKKRKGLIRAILG